MWFIEYGCGLLIVINIIGPNALSLFQPKCDETQELASKVLFYYHPKVGVANCGGCG